MSKEKRIKLPQLSLKVKRIIALCMCATLLGLAVFQSVRTKSHQASNPNATDPNATEKPSSGIVDVNNPTGNDTTEIAGVMNVKSVSEYFAQMRLERMTQRSLESEECVNIINDDTSTEAEILTASEKSSALAMMNELETDLESAIKSRGYEEVFVMLSDNGDVDITVSADTINQNEVTTIASLAVEMLQVDFSSIAVVAVC